MSFLVTRPETPVPVSRAMSTRCSWAILRTTGEERTRRRSSTVAPDPARCDALGISPPAEAPAVHELEATGAAGAIGCGDRSRPSDGPPEGAGCFTAAGGGCLAAAVGPAA